MGSKSEALANIKKRIDEKKGGSQRDPMQWSPPQLKPGEGDQKFKFFILPPLDESDVCAEGQATRGMDGVFYVPVGQHWIRKRPYTCPRVTAGDECPICQYGFDLMDGQTDKKVRSEIAKKWLCTARAYMNIYFTDDKINPEELRGQVRWVAMPKSVSDIMEKTLYRPDDGGDADNLQAYGMFYLTGIEKFDDDSNPGGYVFQLLVTRQKDYNNYEKSDFLPRTLGPLLGKNGKPDTKAIQTILDKRFDLFTKFDAPDHTKIVDLMKKIESGDSDEESTGGFDSDEENDTKKRPEPRKPEPRKPEVKKTEARKPEPKKPAVTEDADDNDEELEGLLSELHDQD